MDPWIVGDLLLIGLALPVSLWLASRGSAVERLVGLQMCSVTTILALLGFGQVMAQPSYLIVPTVAAALSLVGTLVFTRLLAPRP